ncbi:hypothetical protein NC652_012666 [Populus alba x Populus x berolinensis]|nr:hypothetical protein NC652_012666 [Populus alba x Populus x berolinensis]
MELPLVATGQLSDKLGEGGFGPVYKGNILFQKYPISGWLEFSEAMKLKQTPTGSLEHISTQTMQLCVVIQWAWKLWKYSNKALDLMDPSLGDPPSTSMLLRYIKIGLLCVQQIPDDRPTMSDVISMIEETWQNQGHQLMSSAGASSVTNVTITAIDAR